MKEVKKKPKPKKTVVKKTKTKPKTKATTKPRRSQKKNQKSGSRPQASGKNKKPGFFTRVINFFKRLFWIGELGAVSPTGRKVKKPKTSFLAGFKLDRAPENPIMSPGVYAWESQAVFNPAALDSGGRVHLFYRALGPDGLSRIGYASSPDGVNFDVRLTHPVYVARTYDEAKEHFPYTSPARLVYDRYRYDSGGGWGGCEDPRAVVIDGTVYLTFNMFNGWHAMSVAVTSIKESDLLENKWKWSNFGYLSRPDGRQKNWVLFPEKFGGKFAIFHNLDKGDPNKVHIKFVKELSVAEAPTDEEAVDPQLLPDHEVTWHNRTRSAAAPPIKTPDGWLLLYHAMDIDDPGRYKVGAMLLDLKNPRRVLYRARCPVLEPDEWYENDYKPGVVYANGAVVRDGVLYVYYGGGDKHIGVASMELDKFLEGLKNDYGVKLKKRRRFLNIF